MPVASLMSASRLSTCAWIDTSSAATDSSRISSFGSAASARAIATRCRCPPDSALGGTARCRSSRPTSPASSATRSRRRSAVQPWWMRSTSSIAVSALCRGSRLVYGSWKTICTSRPRCRRLPAARAGVLRSLPQALICPLVGRSRPMIILAIVVLPEPDSPTIASDSPSPTVNDTSSTATRSPNSLRRFATLSTSGTGGHP
jgi:hypothetical protein